MVASRPRRRKPIRLVAEFSSTTPGGFMGMALQEDFPVDAVIEDALRRDQEKAAARRVTCVGG
jgi:hypothetical protein